MSYFVIIRGLLGCGKSTISEEISKLINRTHFSIGRVLDENNLLEDKEEGYISQKTFKKANELVCKDSIAVLKQGTYVVFDGNFYLKRTLANGVREKSLENGLNFSSVITKFSFHTPKFPHLFESPKVGPQESEKTSLNTG